MVLLLAIEILVAIIVLLCSSLALYWIYLRKYNYWASKNIPSVPPVPFLGIFSGIFTGESVYGIDVNLYRKYGNIFGAYLGMDPIIYIADPELVKLILVKDFNVFPTRRVIVTGDTWFDNSISNAKGDDHWRNLRNTMTPAFSTGKLKNMIPIITDCATLVTTNFRKYAENQEDVNAKKLFGNFTLDVIANVAFGTRLDSHNDPDNLFVTHASKVFSVEITLKGIILFLLPKVGKLLNISFFPSDSMEFFKNTTESIMERRLKNKEVRHDFLQIMMDSLKEDFELEDNVNDNDKKVGPIEKVDQIKRKPLTKLEVLSQCVLFFIGGYETTATTLAMLSYHLACNPEKQKMVLEEVDRIWEKRESLDADALFEAKYIQAVIDETLRMAPPAIRIERTAEKDYDLKDTGIRIPKGMLVEIPTYAMHHDPELFPEPEVFKPERFLPRDNNEVKPYTYLPFGGGPRNCVAVRLVHLEVKMCVLHVFRHLEFATCSKTLIPMEFMKRSGLLQPKEIILSVLNR